MDNQTFRQIVKNAAQIKRFVKCFLKKLYKKRTKSISKLDS